MDRNGAVVNAGPDSTLMKRINELVPSHPGAILIDKDCVKMQSVARTFLETGRKLQRKVSKCLVISFPDFQTPLPIFFNAADLMYANCRLQIHHVVFVTYFNGLIVLVTVVRESLPGVRNFAIVRQPHAAFAGNYVLR